MSKTIRLKVKRRDTPQQAPYWEEFEIPYRPRMNVISVLQEIQRNPKNAKGETIRPVTWDCSCLEEVCGACTMVINGQVRQSCSALIDNLEQPITLEPMSKFPIVRDLQVDRSKMFTTLKKIKAWIPLDGSHNLGPGPKTSPELSAERYEFSKCMTCGCCCEACPQFKLDGPFMGAFSFGQVHYFNEHPTGEMQADQRLDSVMDIGGIVDCGNAQNCVVSCPKGIPLANAIAELGWDTTKRALKKLFKE